MTRMILILSTKNPLEFVLDGNTTIAIGDN
jgi:hypothetical protein